MPSQTGSGQSGHPMLNNDDFMPSPDVSTTGRHEGYVPYSTFPNYGSQPDKPETPLTSTSMPSQTGSGQSGHPMPYANPSNEGGFEATQTTPDMEKYLLQLMSLQSPDLEENKQEMQNVP
jgi:hypothetical protein